MNRLAFWIAFGALAGAGIVLTLAASQGNFAAGLGAFGAWLAAVGLVVIEYTQKGEK